MCELLEARPDSPGTWKNKDYAQSPEDLRVEVLEAHEQTVPTMWLPHFLQGQLLQLLRWSSSLHTFQSWATCAPRLNSTGIGLAKYSWLPHRERTHCQLNLVRHMLWGPYALRTESILNGSTHSTEHIRLIWIKVSLDTKIDLAGKKMTHT